MNYELKIKYRKILKQQFNAGKITEKEYLNSLESLRDKKPKEEVKELTIINKIKNKIMKTLKTLTVVLVLGLTLLSCNKESIEPIDTPVVPTPIEDPVVTPVNDTLVLTCNNFGNQWVDIQYTSIDGEMIDSSFVLDNTDYYWTGTTTNSIFKFSLNDVNRDFPVNLQSDFNLPGVSEVYMHYKIYINDSLIGSPSIPGNGFLDFDFDF